MINFKSIIHITLLDKEHSIHNIYINKNQSETNQGIIYK